MNVTSFSCLNFSTPVSSCSRSERIENGTSTSVLVDQVLNINEMFKQGSECVANVLSSPLDNSTKTESCPLECSSFTYEAVKYNVEFKKTDFLDSVF